MARARLRGYHVALFALVVLASATLLGPRSIQHGRPHVLLVTIDTIRADHCSVYGYDRATTPTLERVAREGVLFETAYAPMATTAPAHASLFTGLAPARHGVVKNGLALPHRFRTLAEHLATAGYDTAAVVSSFAVHGKFGLRQGFATYDDRFDSEPNLRRWQWEGRVRQGAFDRDAYLTTLRSLRWLRGERDHRRPFFLWVHYFDPHHPYDPATPYDRLFRPDESEDDTLATSIARYDAEIRETDDAVARLLAELDAQNLATATLVIVTGDHGEGLLDHGWMHHGLQLYEESVRVPLLARLPRRIPAGLRLPGPVQLADLAPTILELTGAGHGGTADHPGASISLAPAITGQAALDPDRPIFLQRRRYEEGKRLDIETRGDKLAVRVGGWKYIEAADEDSYELYDLERDPGETRNVAASASDQREHLAARLAAWLADPGRSSAPAVVPNADATRLRALGYVD